jgi:hypothetical protein
MTQGVMYQASDLAKQRRDFIDAGRAGRALLRDTDGFALVLSPLHVMEVEQEIRSTAINVLRTEAALTRPDVRTSELPYGWLLQFDEDDREEFLNEIRDAVTLAESTCDVEPIRHCLDDWQRTARALSDPNRRAILMSSGDDFVEVKTPA